MIISFSVENFRSIETRQEITFLASRHQGHSNALVKVPHVDGGVLPLLAIFGANGAGKSNMLLALNFFREAIIRSQIGWNPTAKLKFDPYMFGSTNSSTFEGTFIVRGKLYRFGFSINASRILKEWLYIDKRVLYRRSENRFRTGTEFKDSLGVRKITRPNSLFLSAAAQSNHPIASQIYAWFSSWDDISDSRVAERVFTSTLIQDQNAKAFLQKAISVIDPNIIGIEEGKVLDDEKLPFEADEQLSQIYKDYRKWSRITFVHRSKSNKIARLSLSSESKGTQDYFSIIGSIIVLLNSGGVLLLDEAGASLHPMLLKAIVMLFQSPKTNVNRAQLILCTHDVTLLNAEILRPDQIWFAERFDEGSNFFSLTDFEGIRSDLKSQKAYLEGRFGAVPFIEDHLDIFAEELIQDGKKR